MMKRLILVLLIVACACEPPEREGERPRPDVKLYVFDCGRLAYDSIESFGISDEETEVRELFVPCYLIEHPKGRLIWDAGLPSDLAEAGDWITPEEGERMKLDRTLAAQLADIGLAMADIELVALSHMHFDHVGAANELTGADLLIQKAEYEAAFADPPTVEFYDPRLYDRLAERPIMVLEGTYDVFGDGRVEIIPAPGHTPGHQVLFVDLGNTGPIVLSGDLYHFRESRELRRVPKFNFDEAQSFASIDEIERMLAERKATLWIEHDLAFHERLKKAPEFYD
ncbi:MAG: N-acyl homoserine lactonase family protein [Gammaproteobacteria bacterium]|jgi:N-acyl homoserine lactone hydrolase